MGLNPTDWHTKSYDQRVRAPHSLNTARCSPVRTSEHFGGAVPHHVLVSSGHARSVPSLKSFAFHLSWEEVSLALKEEWSRSGVGSRE